MLDLTLPNLMFPGVSLGRNETPWDLRPLLFKGGAAARVNRAADLIDAGILGSPVVERIGLVQKIHEEVKAALNGGGKKTTALAKVTSLRDLVSWADATGHPLNLDVIETTYLHWADHLLHRVRMVKDIKEISVYRLARQVGAILDKVLERASPILLSTRLTRPPKRRRVRSVQADKLNLAESFEFGHALLDIVDGLFLDAIWGPLPLRIMFRTGQQLEEWSGLIPPEKLRSSNPQNSVQRYNSKISARERTDYENDRTLRTRYSLVNLRIEAELLVFISQTGMNLSQAHQLKIRHYSYKSTIDGYEVRDYKHRRKGEVLFEIFSDYKEVFDRYLAWREVVFPSDLEGLLFPLVKRGGRAEDTAPKFSRVRGACKKLGLRFISSSLLRNTRVNWVLRRSRDHDLTSQQAQHSKETLARIYEEPSLQVAVVEIARFWQNNDPALQSPAPGICNGVPVPIADIPPGASQPDCIRPTGCLWCEHHRDLDSQDYVWSMASMRHLKIFAFKGFRPPVEGKTSQDPARYVEMAIERLTAKLRWFSQSNEFRRAWVVEALARIDEAFYHPHWHYLVTALEGSE